MSGYVSPTNFTTRHITLAASPTNFTTSHITLAASPTDFPASSSLPGTSQIALKMTKRTASSRQVNRLVVETRVNSPHSSPNGSPQRLRPATSPKSSPFDLGQLVNSQRGGRIGDWYYFSHPIPSSARTSHTSDEQTAGSHSPQFDSNPTNIAYVRQMMSYREAPIDWLEESNSAFVDEQKRWFHDQLAHNPSTWRNNGDVITCFGFYLTAIRTLASERYSNAEELETFPAYCYLLAELILSQAKSIVYDPNNLQYKEWFKSWINDVFSDQFSPEKLDHLLRSLQPR